MLFSLALSVFLLGLAHGTPCLPKACSTASESYEKASSSSMSAVSSTYQASSSSMTSMGSSSCSSFDSAYWQEVFEKCSCFSETERECYLSWLATFNEESLEYYKSIAEYLSMKEALKNEILEFPCFEKDILDAYKYFESENIYNSGCELAMQKAIFEEYAKSKLMKTISCLDTSGSLYKMFKYSIETDYSTLPLTIGIFRGICESQKSYFSSSSSSNSVRSTGSSTSSVSSSTETISSGSSSSSCSSSTFDTSKYQSIMEAASIKKNEYEMYLKYLGQLPSDKMCYFTKILEYYNTGSQCLTTEMMIDFKSFNEEISSCYEFLLTNEFFASNCDWLAKKALLEELKSKLSCALGYISKDCFMYSALQYCLETDTCYCPLFIGMAQYLMQQQCSYFSSCTTTTVTSSSSAGCVCA